MDYKLGTHDTLKQKSSEWIFDNFSESNLIEASMIEFMTANRGIGLAANQIGLSKRIFVMGGFDGFMKPVAMFNPKILERSETLVDDIEGCLSYPGLWLKVKRPEEIVVEFFSSQNELKKMQLSGLAARCFQHEYDHLDGVCFVDKVSQLKLQLAMKKLRKSK
jgi:peptide deformylase